MSKEVYIVNATIEKSIPVLFGVLEDGEQVCIRVVGFEFDVWVAPRDKAYKEENIDMLKWAKEVNQYVRAFNNEMRCSDRDPDALRYGQHHLRRKLCGVGDPVWMVRLWHRDASTLKRVARSMEDNDKGITYNHDVDPILTFLHRTRLRCFQHASISEFKERKGRSWSRCKHEWIVGYRCLQPLEEGFPVSLPVVSFDLETEGLDPNECEIKMIGIHVSSYPFDPKETGTSYLLTRDPMDVEGADYEVEVYSSERELILRFADVVARERAVFVTGWNTSAFDMHFIVQRTLRLADAKYRYVKKSPSHKSPKRAPRVELSNLAKLSWFAPDTRKVYAYQKSLDTSAFGHNDMTILTVAGTIFMDGLLLARKQLKLQSYSLASVAQWAGHEKGDVTYKEMVEAFDTKCPAQLRRVADYCVQDARVVIPILIRMEEPVKVCAMSTLAAVPPDYVIQRGMQILTWSLILEESRRHQMVPNRFKDEETEYEGATVIPPKSGYYPDVVCVLDFKSLYPSCMMAHNVCVSTKVTTAKRTERLEREYPKDTYSIVPIGQGKVSVFHREGRRGVIPIVLQRLSDARQSFKKAMKAYEPGSVRYQQLNARQNAVKISMNSIYGFLGARTSPVSAVDIAASVTSLGRIALDMTREHIDLLKSNVEIPVDTEIVYGDTDSVMVWFPGKSVEEAEELAKFISARVTAIFYKPMELEYEAWMKPCLFLTKKRYAGNTGSKLLIKGIATQRRDYPRVVQRAIQGVLDALLKSTDGKGRERALAWVESILDEIVSRRVPREELIVVKEINKLEYKAASLPPHVEVAHKIAKRQPERAVKAGDRISFIIVRSSRLDASVGERSEDPEYAQQNGLHPDMRYYTNMASQQVMDLLEKAGLKAEGERITQRAIQRATALVPGQKPLSFAQSFVAGAKRPLADATQPAPKLLKQTSLPFTQKGLGNVEGRKKTATKQATKATGKQTNLASYFQRKPNR